MGIFVCLTYDSEWRKNQTEGMWRFSFVSHSSWALGYEVFKTNKRSLNQMYDVPSMCSTANRKTNSFKDNVKVQNSKMGNSPQKRTHTHNNNSPKNKLNKKAQQNTKTLTKNREDRDSKDKDHLLFSFNILFCLTRRSRLVRKYKLW